MLKIHIDIGQMIDYHACTESSSTFLGLFWDDFPY